MGSCPSSSVSRMKLFLATFLALAVATQASLFDEWKSFKASHGKVYSKVEDGTRFAIWEANRAMVEKHNAGDHSYTMALNEASDWTQDEMNSRWLGLKPEGQIKGKRIHYQLTADGPDHLDHREGGLVTPVKNQGQCGSCWAFSATGSLEGMWAKQNGELLSLSEQQLVDCGVGSCNGGYMTNAYDDAKNGIQSEDDYPYEGRDGSCRYDSNSQVAHCNGYERVSGSENSMEAAIYEVGYPLSVAIHVGSSFQHYSGGVYSDHSCKNGQVNHGVLVVGFDKTGSTPYWIVKNSWGASWGDGGYINMEMGYNTCQIAYDPMYPTL